MGIINITPDSFHEGSRFVKEKNILDQVEKMVKEGADFIDIGGYSSRPGATDISAEEEKTRVVNNINLISKTFPKTYLSIDTFRASVAKEAVEAGACLVNDISGGELDADMFSTVARLKVPYIMMHMRGTPQTMNQLTQYENLTVEILDFFQKRLKKLRDLGIIDVIVDPGFGFAKNIEQNYELLKNLSVLQMLELPVLVGLSRKGMIYKQLGVQVEEALNGTTVLNTIALMNGASILRVHDVKEAIQAVRLFKLTYS